MLESFFNSFPLLLGSGNFLTIIFVIALGLLIGLFVGALPGLTTLMAMAIVLPISFFMDPLVGIPFLIGVYKGGIFGGSIPAILVSLPGTGASVATTFDGPPLTKMGKGRKALETALFSSVIADFSSDIVTILLIGPIALVALLIGPPELAAILFLSILIISSTSNGSVGKNMIMLATGLFIAMIGQDPIAALSRFTFDVFELRAGVPLLPMLIGLFAVPEILINIETKAKEFVKTKLNLKKEEKLTWEEFLKLRKTILRSTVIGTTIGMIPGVGQVVAAFVGYAAAKNSSKTPEKFGKGELEGIAAPEAANNAVNGPTLVPLLTLGIPGDNITAILLGAFIAHGLRPGPELMSEQGSIVFAILLCMLIANILFLILGYFTMPLFSKVVTIKKSYLIPLTIIFAFAGSFVFRHNPADLYFLLFFGIFGYILKKLQFDVTPLVMAFILAPSLEYAFGQTLSLGDDNVLMYLLSERPIAALIIVSTPVITWKLFQRSKKLRDVATSLTSSQVKSS